MGGITEKQLDVVEKEGKAADAYLKLNRKNLDIDVPKYLGTVRQLEGYLAEAEKQGYSAEEVDKIEQKLKEIKKEQIVASFVSLSAQDLIHIQAFVAEAIKRSGESDFDTEVRLFMMLRAEQCATIWLALRKREDHSKRYFGRMEDTVLSDDETLRELAKLYKENFVLTEEERKNL